MRLGDTIAALATGPGRSARAILRLSGPDSADAVRALGADWDGGRTVRRVVVDLPHGPLPCLLVGFEPGASYTGEAAAELQVPGSPHLSQRIIERLCAQPNVRLAEPGEFTARALLAGRLTPEQAEGVGAVIGARSRRELDAAARLLSGETGDAYRALADDLAGALALVEAGIDFTDQDDVVAITTPDLAARLGALRAAIGERLAPAGPAAAPDAAPLVALVGPPNAGKSTLFNALLDRRRVVVADLPGTTRDVIREPLDLTDPAGRRPLRVTLADLPGLDHGPADDAERAAQDRADDAVNAADVLVYCDPAGAFPPLPSVKRDHPAPVLHVRTKADLGPPAGDALATCALDGWNLGALRRAVADAVHGARAGAETLAPPRHEASLRAAAGALDDALAHLHADDDPAAEVVADLMRAGLDALGELAGGVSPDDVIGRIFATFCVGK